MATECKLIQHQTEIQSEDNGKYEGEYNITNIDSLAISELALNPINGSPSNFCDFTKNHFQRNVVNNDNRPSSFSYLFKGIKFTFKQGNGYVLNYLVSDEISGFPSYYKGNGLGIFEKSVVKQNWEKFTEEVYNLLLADEYSGPIMRDDGTLIPQSIDDKVKKRITC